MQTLCEKELDFVEAQKVCKEPWSGDITPYMDNFIQEGFLFKNHQLCIPRETLGENLIRELHNGGLSGHFGVEKTRVLVEK